MCVWWGGEEGGSDQVVCLWVGGGRLEGGWGVHYSGAKARLRTSHYSLCVMALAGMPFMYVLTLHMKVSCGL